MISYNPFNSKNTLELNTSDLSVLKSVKEGWYVEYKQAISNAQTIAKSVSSFANTYGGWLFYGIEEADDNTAGVFCGIANDGIQGQLQKIQHAISAHVNPIPHFNYKLLEGPNEELGLASDRSVICLEVPMSNLTPHLHSSGRIFRRVGESSIPQPETDRHQLDLLFSRSEKLDLAYEDWVRSDPERSQGEEGRPYLRLLLDADHCGLGAKKWSLSTSDVMDTMNDKSGGQQMPVEACYPSDRGVVARQHSSLYRHADFGLTWLFGPGLKAEIWLPLNACDTLTESHLVPSISRCQHAGQFFKCLEAAKVNDGKVLELNQLWDVVLAIHNTFIRLLERNGTPPTKYHVKTIMNDI